MKPLSVQHIVSMSSGKWSYQVVNTVLNVYLLKVVLLFFVGRVILLLSLDCYIIYCDILHLNENIEFPKMQLPLRHLTYVLRHSVTGTL